ncbi:hypothetical protein BD413DRAFT_6998 [Trametes elegans]|nr:hypothetical protein BD413DRAFT_6998 [Trametes elegans]
MGVPLLCSTPVLLVYTRISRAQRWPILILASLASSSLLFLVTRSSTSPSLSSATSPLFLLIFSRHIFLMSLCVRGHRYPMHPLDAVDVSMLANGHNYMRRNDYRREGPVHGRLAPRRHVPPERLPSLLLRQHRLIAPPVHAPAQRHRLGRSMGGGRDAEPEAHPRRSRSPAPSPLPP